MEKKNVSNMREAVYISWEESERGWGTRPDGFSLHLTENDFRNFERDYWAGMPESAPDEYSRPAGSPTQVRVSEGLYEEIEKTENGTRRYDEGSLVKEGSLVFISRRSGWVPMGEI